MAEYIDRDGVLAEYDRQHQGPPGGARKIIAEYPAADVVEVRHGKWILDGGYHMCSECYDYAPYYEDGEERLSYFCPFCGADMRGE